MDVNAQLAQLDKTITEMEKAERSRRFWQSIDWWDAFITQARLITWGIIMVLFFTGVILGWNSHVMWCAVGIPAAAGFASYGWSAMKVRTWLVVRLAFALLLTAPLVGVIWFGLNWSTYYPY